MPATKFDLLVEQGATWNLQLTWTDSSGAVIDLTGYRIHAQFRTARAQLALDMDSSSPVTGVTFGVLDSTGLINLTVSPTITATFDTALVYDLLAISSNGTVTRLLEGAVKVSPAVTV